MAKFSSVCLFSPPFFSLLLLFLVFLSASFSLTIVEIQRRELMDKQAKKKNLKENRNKRWKGKKAKRASRIDKNAELLRWGEARPGQKTKVVLPWGVCSWAEQEDEEGVGQVCTECGPDCAWIPSAGNGGWNTTRATIKSWCDPFPWLLLEFL